MYNPSYLIQSRHNIFYFRYPLPKAIRQQGRTAYVTLSLRTRDPKEALQLANILSYHAGVITSSGLIMQMDYGDVVAELKKHFLERVEAAKKRIYKNGPREVGSLTALENGRGLAESAIMHGYDAISSDEDLKRSLQPILARFDPKPEEGSFEYGVLKSQYKFAYKKYCEDVLAYNKELSELTFSSSSIHDNASKRQNKLAIPKYRLSNVIDKYRKEKLRTNSWGPRAKDEFNTSIAYLLEFLGEEIDILDVDIPVAREVKEALMATPKNRNKIKAIRELSLKEQIRLTDVETMAVGTINKYIQYYSGLFLWAKRNGYCEVNPFEKLKLPETRDKKRHMFNDDDAKLILEELDKIKLDKAKDERNYWGTLIALHTGARLNEIASLTPDDVKQEANGIWYFDINDEIEDKRLKTSASKRRVPIHSELLNRGLLEYVKKVQGKAVENTRLLYDLT